VPFPRIGTGSGAGLGRELERLHTFPLALAHRRTGSPTLDVGGGRHRSGWRSGEGYPLLERGLAQDQAGLEGAYEPGL